MLVKVCDECFCVLINSLLGYTTALNLPVRQAGRATIESD